MSLCVSLAHLLGGCITNIVTTVAPYSAQLSHHREGSPGCLPAVWALDWAQVVPGAHPWLVIVPSLSEDEFQNRLLPTSSPAPAVTLRPYWEPKWKSNGSQAHFHVNHRVLRSSWFHEARWRTRMMITPCRSLSSSFVLDCRVPG